MKTKIYKKTKPMKRRKSSEKNATFKKAILFKQSIKVKFPYNINNLEEIRNINGREWHQENKYWTIPLTLDNCFRLKSLNYQLNQSLKNWANKYYKITEDKKPLIIPEFNGSLLEYQNEGIRMLHKFNGNALLADEMGLGKSVQAIAFLLNNPKLRPALIICPAFLKYDWKNKFDQFAPKLNYQIIFGTDTSQELYADIIIINYNLLSNKFEDTGQRRKDNGKTIMKEISYTGWVDYLIDYDFRIAIADEAHYIKNEKTLMGKAALKLSKYINRKIAMTGTPIEGKTIDLYNPIKFIDPKLFPNKWSFSHEYCGPYHNGFGWQFNGATNTEKLNSILREHIMIRRLKQDVLTDLPDKSYSLVPLAINNWEEYEKAEQDFKEYIKDKTEIDVRNAFKKVLDLEAIEINDFKLERLKEKNARKANPLAQITMLKKLASQGKLQATIQWIENFLESGEKLIVFCEHLFVIDSLVSHFKNKSVAIHGGVSMKKRNELVQQFQEDKKIKLFIGNSAAQEGLTLTAASNVAIIEYPWNPGQISQRIDRCHRIGQKNAVMVWFICALDTIEEKIAKLLDKKQSINQAILDGDSMNSYNLLTELIDNYLKH
jgi:SWI/SNF-related matrix-associated actin-dependent regulator 1 of chromatin subfamily A